MMVNKSKYIVGEIDVNELGENLRRALSRAMGYRDKDFEKPFVAVVHGWSEISPGHFHLRIVARYVKEAISASGGTPAEIIVPGICGSMSGGLPVFRYNVPYRDFAASLIEIMISLNRFDGAVLIPTCDNVVPAYLMAAARTNIPTILLTGGYMQPGEYKGKSITAFNVSKEYGRFVAGGIEKEELDEIINCACPTPGACPEMGTANTMCTASEVLGMSLPGNTCIPASDARLLRLARQAGEQILYLIKEKIRPSDIMPEKLLKMPLRLF